jgi:hypothetical protein
MLDGLFRLSTEPQEKPRWFRVLTISGKPAGLGFYCDKCHLSVPHDAPDEVFHCGAKEKAPLITALLPTFRLGRGCRLPSNLIPTDW